MFPTRNVRALACMLDESLRQDGQLFRLDVLRQQDSASHKVSVRFKYGKISFKTLTSENSTVRLNAV